jgi:hypothetical protein
MRRSVSRVEGSSELAPPARADHPLSFDEAQARRPIASRWPITQLSEVARRLGSISMFFNRSIALGAL